MASKQRISLILVLLLILSVSETTLGYSGGKTGSTTAGCGCHGASGGVTPTLSGLPSSGYEETTEYTLNIGGTGGPSGTKGGFNLDADQGSWSNPGTNTKLQNGEVTHSNSNSRSWSVNWTSPANGSGTVTFYVAVNFANGNGGTSGDDWATNSWTLDQVTTSNGDTDGDGWSDTDESACGTDSNDNSSIPTDTDSDGICDPVDTDDDGDGWSDSDETSCGTESNNSTSIPTDTDSDGICDPVDTDDDGDGWNDTDESDCGTNSTNSSSIPLDTDSDGICDILDSDDDNDSWLDTDEDLCGTDSKNSTSIPEDTDGDRI